MDGASKFLLELSIMLVLVVLLATVGYLWLRARKELGHLRQLFDELPDLVLPGQSGDVVMQEMLEQNPQLPIIVCTGNSQAINSAASCKANNQSDHWL
jgi:FixJ family two-component response regulator